MKVQNTLNHYQELNSIFGVYIQKKVSQNNELTNSPGNIIMRYAKNNHSILLNKINTALSSLHMKIKSNHLEELRKRLISEDNFVCYSAIIELCIYYELGIKLGFENVDYGKTLAETKKNPDLFFKVGVKEVFLEITALNKRKSEEAIESCFNRIINKYIDSAYKNYFLHILIEPTSIKNDDKGRIEIAHLDNSIANGIERLCIFESAKSYSLPISSIKYYCRNQVFDVETLLDIKFEASVLSHPIHNLLDHIDDKTAELIRIKDIMTSPFVSLSVGRITNKKCIEISLPEYDFPVTNVNDLEGMLSSTIRKAILDHLSRRLVDKIKHGQADGSKSFILAIHFDDIFRYPLNEEESYKEIENLVKNVLSMNENSFLISGVWIFSGNSLFYGKFIANTNAIHHISNKELLDLNLLR
jgi:hypothetical protein